MSFAEQEHYLLIMHVCLYMFLCTFVVQLGVLCPRVNVVCGLLVGVLDDIVRSAKRLCEGEISCLGHRRKVSALCWLYKIYHREEHPMNGYLNSFVANRNFRVSASLGKLALVILRCRTDQFSRSFLSPAGLLWNLLPLGVVSGDTLTSFKSAMNLCLLRA